MLFNSIFFICGFLPVVALGFFLFGRASQHLAALWLCGASLFFYGWWNVNYVWLLLTSVVFNYTMGYLIGRAGPRRSQAWLTLAVTADLLLLGYYKYTAFFLDSWDQVTGFDWSLGHIILPLGISFFSFTQIAFLVDVYRKKASEYNFVHYLLFVTYFPHLIAGPILHHAQMMPQFAQRTTYHLNWKNIAMGTTIFIIGLGKKVLMADLLSGYSRPIFQGVTDGGTPMFMEAWIGALSYTLQLYFDFSGYTDMAIGISLMFNIRLPLNFNSPYKAASIVDFWRRWHMTLSAFLRDYLYISLGGNRCGPVRRYVNLLLTMLLGGLWHGAGWTFVVWGGLHGLYLCINHAFMAFRQRIGWEVNRFGKWESIPAVGLTFLSVMVAWVFFRADNLASALSLLRGMAGLNGLSLPAEWQHSSLMAHLGWLPGFHHAVFNGYMPLTFPVVYYSNNSLPKLALGLFIVWFLPNTQQWMGYVEEKAASAPAGLLGILSRFHWQPERWYVWLSAGLVLGFSMLEMASGPASEFLYFQF
jgi:alginate O-acetyltransferase complex protein AlgI